MSIFDLFQRRKVIRGEIGYHKLAERWYAAFTDDERKRILEVFRPLGGGENPLLEGTISASSESALSFLTNLSGWFKKDGDRQIGYKILAKAEQLVPASASALDKHFFFQAKIEMHYCDRDNPRHLAEAEHACREQIAVAGPAAGEFAREFPGALPEHKGYKQLTIILDNRGATGEAVEVARRAQSEGWSGDWVRRIERYSGT